jgi:hypothetical protein
MASVRQGNEMPGKNGKKKNEGECIFSLLCLLQCVMYKPGAEAILKKREGNTLLDRPARVF